MLDTRYNSVVYQSQVYVSALVDKLIVSKKTLGKEKDKLWAKVDKIYAYLEALQETPKLTDPTEIIDITFILECLIVLCEISSFPVVPSLMWIGTPNLIVGLPGAKGDKGDKGDNGATGLATDFQVNGASTTIVTDSFLITDAKAARWDYVVVEVGGAQRAGSVIGHWKSDGSITSLIDTADDDTTASTDGIEFDIQGTGTNIYFIAVITSGTWSIYGSRYFIPNNGNGTGPISGVLPNGKIYIGNNLSLAQDQYMSGAISLVDNTGVTQINPNYILNSMVAPGAAIAVSKLQALIASKLVVTDSSGILTTTNSPTLTELGYVGGVISPIQTQLNTKITDVTTSIGDLIYRNVSNVIARLGIGAANQVLTVVGGVPTWQNPVAGFSDPMTTIGDIMIRNGSNITSRLGIGSTNQVLTVIGGIPTWRTPTVTGGTVTSISATQPAAGLTISGSPITTSGTFTFTLANDLAAVEGLTSTGIIRRTAPEVWSAGGLVQISEGGTNTSSYTTGDILYASATNILAKRSIGSPGQVLQVTGGSLPAWGDVPAAGLTTQVQFNSGGVLGASSQFLWTGNQLNVNDGIISNLSISTAPGGFALIQAPDGSSGSPHGGNVYIYGGAPFGGGAYGVINLGTSRLTSSTNIAGITYVNHIVGSVGVGGASPTVTTGAGAGTGGSASLTSSTDTAGSININIGTTPVGSSPVVTLTFNVPYSKPPVVVISPGNDNGVAMYTNKYYVTSTTSSFTINTIGVSSSVTGFTQVINYHVVGAADTAA